MRSSANPKTHVFITLSRKRIISKVEYGIASLSGQPIQSKLVILLSSHLSIYTVCQPLFEESSLETGLFHSKQVWFYLYPESGSFLSASSWRPSTTILIHGFMPVVIIIVVCTCMYKYILRMDYVWKCIYYVHAYIVAAFPACGSTL